MVRTYILVGLLCALLGMPVRAYCQAFPGDMSVASKGQSVESDLQDGGHALVEQTQDPSNGLTEETRGFLATSIASVGFMAATFAFFFRKYDWQSVGRTCTRCSQIHHWLGSISTIFDVVSQCALYYLLALPLGAALSQGSGLPTKALFCVVLLGGLVVGQTAAGIVLRKAIGLMSRNSIPANNPLTHYLTGSRALSCALLLALGPRGLGEDSVSHQLDLMVGPHLSTRLVAAIGLSPIRQTLITLAIGLSVSMIVRWVVPIWLGSRPLAFLKDSSTSKVAVKQALA